MLYRDGVSVDDANNVTAAPAPTGSTHIARFLNNNDFSFHGLVDNVMIFDRALTANEIGSLYNGGSGTEEITDDTSYSAFYLSNGWNVDVAEDFKIKIDYYFSDITIIN